MSNSAPSFDASSFEAALQAALPAASLAFGDAIAVRHHADWSGLPPVRPRALVRPATTEEVSAALRICHQFRVPVVPQGGMTGLAGGALPSADSVALSLDRMNTIESIDKAGATATVQAGVTLQQLHEAAQAQNLSFGVDLGARGSCQIGGNLATNAGGNSVLRQGMMREQALGLEVVLADGTVLPMLRPMVKNNTGYDLKQFFIGAEGTLGVITRALLRLRPADTARATALIAMPDFDAAVKLLGRLQQRFPGTLSAFELMWEDFLSTAVQWLGVTAPFAPLPPLAALVDVAGQDEAALAEALEAVLGDAMEAGEVTDAVVAQSHNQARSLWNLREIPAEFATRTLPINFDVSLPTASIGVYADDCVAALAQRWPGHRTLRFGHIGDGNLHLTVDMRSLGDDALADPAHTIHAVDEVVYSRAAAYGGSISAEHGIGLIKKPFLGLSRTPAELAIMKAIKQALDPLGLMNPGKVLDAG